jgi:hypothetical protein
MKQNGLGFLPAALIIGLVLMLAPPAQAQAEPPPKTHLGGKASAMVHLVTPLSPVLKGETSTFIQLDPYGSPVPDFTLPEHSVLVVTDVVAFNCRLEAGRYVALLLAQGSPSPKVPIYFDTTVDGEEKHIRFTSGVVFGEVPEVTNSTLSVSDLCVTLYGYVAMAQDR